jgi:hypothetical protein
MSVEDLYYERKINKYNKKIAAIMPTNKKYASQSGGEDNDNMYYERKINKYNKKIAGMINSSKDYSKKKSKGKKGQWGGAGEFIQFKFEDVSGIELVVFEKTTDPTKPITPGQLKPVTANYMIDFKENPEVKNAVKKLVEASQKFIVSFENVDESEYEAIYSVNNVDAICVKEGGCETQTTIKEGASYKIRLCLNIFKTTLGFVMMAYATEIRTNNISGNYLGYINFNALIKGESKLVGINNVVTEMVIVDKLPISGQNGALAIIPEDVLLISAPRIIDNYTEEIKRLQEIVDKNKTQIQELEEKEKQTIVAAKIEQKKLIKEKQEMETQLEQLKLKVSTSSEDFEKKSTLLINIAKGVIENNRGSEDDTKILLENNTTVQEAASALQTNVRALIDAQDNFKSNNESAESAEPAVDEPLVQEGGGGQWWSARYANI